MVAPHPVTFLTELQVELLGIFISIRGAVTVVFSANTSDTRLDRDALIVAITQKPFIIYSIIYIIGTFALAGLYCQPTWPRLGSRGCRVVRAFWYVFHLLVRRVPFLSQCRRVHRVIDNKSAVNASHNGMDKDIHRVNHLSNRCCKFVYHPRPTSLPINTISSRSSLALESVK